MSVRENEQDNSRYSQGNIKMPVPCIFEHGPDNFSPGETTGSGNCPDPRQSEAQEVNWTNGSKRSSRHQDTPFQRWRSRQPRASKLQQQEPWEHCRKLVSEYDAEMCRSWKAEIDNLLIFAGLFSATVTAFTIESYKWLQSDASTYEAQLLSLIYEQLNPDTGAELLAEISSSSPFSQGPVVRINILWFLSLSLSLTTVLVGIVVAQWLREYERDVSLPSKARLAIRQMRYQGLVSWQVPRIIALLPLLLQAGFILFLVGILDLLWNLEQAVAIPITVFIGLVFVFQCVTVGLPALQYIFTGANHVKKAPQCPYKSPQSLGVLRFVLAVFRALPRRWKGSLNPCSSFARLKSSSYLWSWPEIDVHWHSSKGINDLLRSVSEQGGRRSDTADDTTQALEWVLQHFRENEESVGAVYKCIQELPIDEKIETIRNLSTRLDTLACMAFDNLLRSEPGLSAESLEDVVTITFLHGFRLSRDSVLWTDYWESQIRLMNNPEVNRNYIHWSAAAVQFERLPEESQWQLLSALNGMLQSDSASLNDVQNTWILLQEITTSKAANLQISDSIWALALSLFDSMGAWLTSCEPEIEVRVKVCLEGMLSVVYDDFVDDLGGCRGYGHIVSFLHALDRTLREVRYPTDIVFIENNIQFTDSMDLWRECIQRVCRSA